MIIAFDVDGTLINFDNTPNYRVIDILRWFQQNGDRIIIWSGGGMNYAEHWNNKLGLNADEVVFKTKESALKINPDIAFDDEFINLGKVNIKINNF